MRPRDCCSFSRSGSRMCSWKMDRLLGCPSFLYLNIPSIRACVNEASQQIPLCPSDFIWTPSSMSAYPMLVLLMIQTKESQKVAAVMSPSCEITNRTSRVLVSCHFSTLFFFSFSFVFIRSNIFFMHLRGRCVILYDPDKCGCENREVG